MGVARVEFSLHQNPSEQLPAGADNPVESQYWPDGQPIQPSMVARPVSGLKVPGTVKVNACDAESFIKW